MRNDYREFTKKGATVVVVVKAEAGRVKAYWGDERLPFLAIADPEGDVSERFGQEWRLLRLGRLPALLVVDCQGEIVYSHYGTSMADIPTNAVVLEVLKGLPPCGGLRPAS